MQTTDDAMLVAAAADGDTDAFAGLVTRYRQSVYRLLRRIVGDHHWADDLAQETFVKLWDHLGVLREGAAVGGWLRRVARNLGLNHVRGRKRRHETPCEQIETEAAADGRPESQAESRELAEGIDAALAALPPERRAVLLLRVQQGLTYEQISRQMNCRPATVASRLHRARLQVRDFLSESAQI
jgi:RNA polymerase sigma-70 factor (ECF subfamily)